MDKRISLIIPTYNCIDYIDETLASVLSQLPHECELVIIDDGSDDGTAERLAEMRGTQGNVNIVLREHEGVSGARNAGLREARGEFIAYMDCDDCLKPCFFEKSMPLLEGGEDLYIFSFDRVEFNKDEETGMICRTAYPLMVADRRFETVSDFADEYVRDRHLLVYSACNKFYRRNIISEYGIRFADGISFGEDRLFNYEYLKHCGAVRTSSVYMFDYLQRNPESASKRHFPDHFETVMMLHKAKMECFLGLSCGTEEDERVSFISYDLSAEIDGVIDRFKDHPEEADENLPGINRLIFGETDDVSGSFDIILVLGSTNCGHRAATALSKGRRDPDTKYIVSGGNMHNDGKHTEAEYMAEFLRINGISDDYIFIENKAAYTAQNLSFSLDIIRRITGGDLKGVRIGIVTGGFHIPRARLLAERIGGYQNADITFIPAYTQNTSPDAWYLSDYGRKYILDEIVKTSRMHQKTGAL